MPSFLICGYGIPKDIHTDENHQTYLHVAFNKIYSQCANQACTIIPCGGPTEMEPPYEGTEAAAIGRYLEEMMRRPELREQTAAWKIVLEDQSLSTLENLLFAKRLLPDPRGPVTIFCEATRRQRVQETAKRVFGGEVHVEPIDFDVSKNRYRDAVLLRKNEEDATREMLWTLESEERLAQHHELFVVKFIFFRERQAQGVSHVDVVQEWFEKMPILIKELMPEHPLFQDQEDV